MYKIVLTSDPFEDGLCWSEEIGGCVGAKDCTIFETAHSAAEVVDHLAFAQDTCDYSFSIVPIN
jgi:hypothetical protein